MSVFKRKRPKLSEEATQRFLKRARENEKKLQQKMRRIHMTTMNRNEFFEQIRESFFIDLEASLDGFKSMVNGALPVFGELETVVTEKEDGKKSIQFIDRDEADLVIGPEGVNIDEVDTDMTTTIMTLHLNKENVIEVVEHGFGMFTPANKNHVLLLASFIGKKITFE